MTTLALAVDADDELWTLDDLPPPEAPYVEVGSELIEVRSRFPSQTYTLTGETLPPKIRVRRGIAGTTKASHIQGSTLTPNYGLGSGGGGVAIAVDNTVDEPVEVTGIVAPGATFDGDVASLSTAALRASPEDPVIIQAAAGAEASGGPLFYVAGEVDNEILSLNAYGNLSLRGSVVDPTNDGASLQIFGPDSGAEVFGVVADNVETNAQIRVGAATTKVGFFGANAIAQPAANADTSGATLGDLETEVNQLKATLRVLGLIAT